MFQIFDCLRSWVAMAEHDIPFDAANTVYNHRIEKVGIAARGYAVSTDMAASNLADWRDRSAFLFRDWRGGCQFWFATKSWHKTEGDDVHLGEKHGRNKYWCQNRKRFLALADGEAVENKGAQKLTEVWVFRKHGGWCLDRPTRSCEMPRSGSDTDMCVRRFWGRCVNQIRCYHGSSKLGSYKENGNKMAATLLAVPNGNVRTGLKWRELQRRGLCLVLTRSQLWNMRRESSRRQWRSRTTDKDG